MYLARSSNHSGLKRGKSVASRSGMRRPISRVRGAGSEAGCGAGSGAGSGAAGWLGNAEDGEEVEASGEGFSFLQAALEN